MHRIGIAAIVAGCLLGGTALARENQPDQGDREAFRRQMREHHRLMREAAQAHYSGQREQNEAFREALKESDASAPQCIARIREHRANQYRENITFRQKQYRERLDFLKDQEGLDKARKTELRERLTERHQRMEEALEQRHDRWMALLNELSGREDLDRKTLMKSLQEFAQERPEGFRRRGMGPDADQDGPPRMRPEGRRGPGGEGDAPRRPRGERPEREERPDRPERRLRGRPAEE